LVFVLKNFAYSSRLMGSVVVGVAFLLLRWDRPLRSLRKDSLSDFFRDFLLDMGLSSAFAISGILINFNKISENKFKSAQ
jgi:hypothetical protein